MRALLAACALPCNRAYLLLTNHAAQLAVEALPAAVEHAADATRRAADAADAATLVSPVGAAAESAAERAAAADALLLPLLKLLRLIVATPPPAEPARKLQSDLVCLLIFSGGLHQLQDYCTEVSATLAGAARHQPLLLQYVALLHSLLLPLHADPGCSCASPLLAFLEETALCGLPGLLCAILYEGKHLTASPSAHAGGGALALPAAWRLSAAVLAVCRSGVQLLVHLATIDAAFVRRVLGCNELRMQTFHLAHLVLQHHLESGASAAGGAVAAGATSPSTPLPAGVAAELMPLLHETLLLLGQYTLGNAYNAEVLRWRWGEHPTMLQRLCSLPFEYFCHPQLRRVLLPTLLAGCLHDVPNFRILSQRLSAQHLVRFVREHQARPPPSSGELTPAALLSADPSELPMVSMDFALSSRVPPAQWNAALAFLSAPRPVSPPSEGETPGRREETASPPPATLV